MKEENWTDKLEVYSVETTPSETLSLSGATMIFSRKMFVYNSRLYRALYEILSNAFNQDINFISPVPYVLQSVG